MSMAAVSTVSVPSQFQIINKEVKANWDKFCEESLDVARFTMRKKAPKRYDDVNEGVQLISRFIAEQGWKAFDALAVAYGAGALAGGGLIAGALMVGSSPAGWVMGLVGGAAVGGCVYGAYKLYERKELVIKVHGILSPYKDEFDNHTREINLVFHDCVVTIIDKIYGHEILLEDTSLPMNPVCICGGILVPSQTKNCYGNEFSYVICDICDKKISDTKDLFHCPARKNIHHPLGYDVCIDCARKHNDGFKKYHALIIQSIDESGSTKCKDAINLEKLFRKLNYHSIHVLKEQNATKTKITQKLKELSAKNKNDVIVVVYSGHGEIIQNEWVFWLENNKSIRASEFIKNLLPMNDIEYGQQALSKNCTCDIVILLNACFSGKFPKQAIIEDDQKYNDRLDVKELIKQYENASRSVVTITSCKEYQESSGGIDGVSPFIQYILDVFGKDDMVTPKSIYEYVKTKSNETNELGITWNSLQSVDQPLQQGQFADNIPLIPIAQPYTK